DGHVVTIDLPLEFEHRLKHEIDTESFQVEVMAADKHGNSQGFDRAGTLRLVTHGKHSPGADPTRPALFEPPPDALSLTRKRFSEHLIGDLLSDSGSILAGA